MAARLSAREALDQVLENSTGKEPDFTDVDGHNFSDSESLPSNGNVILHRALCIIVDAYNSGQNHPSLSLPGQNQLHCGFFTEKSANELLMT